MGCQKKQNGPRMSFDFLDCSRVMLWSSPNGLMLSVLLVQPSSAAAERVFFDSTALYSSVEVIFGRLPGTLCYVAIQPWLLDSLICTCTLITVCKKKTKWVKEGAKWVNWKSKIGRFIKHKSKAK